MLLTTDELNQLQNAKSEAEWNSICNGIKRARQGQYPDDWYAKVVMSGLMALVSSGWKS
jgi:hypothetical protein